MWQQVLLMVLGVICLGSCQSSHCNCNEEQWETMKNELRKEMIVAISDGVKKVETVDSELLRQRYLGEEWKYPAYSCSEITKKKPNFTSGEYWVKANENNTPYRIYCDLETEYVPGIKGWERVANWNMNEQSDCPRGFNLVTSPRRLCGKGTDGYGCDGIYSGIYGTFGYKHVCGRVVLHRHRTPDGFRRYNCPSPCTINDAYLDGVSITTSSWGHVWSFSACTCNSPGAYPPAFVGNNYFCDCSNGPLWSDQWFCTELQERRTDYLRLRLCTDQNRADEDVRIELVELYVH